MNDNPYLPVRSVIEEVTEETPSIKTFRVRPDRPVPFRAGQFVELDVPGLGEAPFTPSSSPAVTDHMEITIMRVGCVTERLHTMTAGAEVGIRGPLGQPYPLDAFHGKEILLVGGGVGLAPLRALLFALFEQAEKFGRVMVRYGARTPGDLVYRRALADGWGRDGALDVNVTVDEADAEWKGRVGVVTTILDRDALDCHPDNGVAVVCGPPVMMKFTTLKLLDRGYKPGAIYLSMEKNMSCGIGKCGHCRIGTRYACKEGPVFTYGQIQAEPRIWD